MHTATGSNNNSCPPIIQHPYVVSIERKNIPVGGGSIISRYLILSTSTIINKTSSLSQLSVRTGSSYSNKYGIVHNVCNAYIHPNNANDTPSRIGILRLDKSIIFDEKIQPIRYFFLGDNIKWRDSQLIITAWQNIFDLGSKESTQLNIFEGPLDNSTICTGNVVEIGMICVDKLFPSDWSWDVGHGHPVVIDGMQAGLVVYSDDRSTYISDLVPYSHWIQQRIEEETSEQCPNKDGCHSYH